MLGKRVARHGESRSYNVNHPSPSQSIAADLQTRVKSEFQALHQILHDEEACTLEQLRREQEEELVKVQHHLEVTEQAAKELEDNIKALQEASTATQDIVLTEVGIENNVTLFILLSDIIKSSNWELIIFHEPVSNKLLT